MANLSHVFQKLESWCPPITDDADLRMLEKFVIAMYYKSCTAAGVDDARLYSLPRGRGPWCLPPTRSSLAQHVKPLIKLPVSGLTLQHVQSTEPRQPRVDLERAVHSWQNAGAKVNEVERESTTPLALDTPSHSIGIKHNSVWRRCGATICSVYTTNRPSAHKSPRLWPNLACGNLSIHLPPPYTHTHYQKHIFPESILEKQVNTKPWLNHWFHC